jgi:hypothetical protein
MKKWKFISLSNHYFVVILSHGAKLVTIHIQNPFGMECVEEIDLSTVKNVLI